MTSTRWCSHHNHRGSLCVIRQDLLWALKYDRGGRIPPPRSRIRHHQFCDYCPLLPILICLPSLRPLPSWILGGRFHPICLHTYNARVRLLLLLSFSLNKTCSVLVSSVILP
jgi:hypothetical protein